MTAHTELGSSQINHNHIVTFRNDTPTQLLYIVKKQFQPKWNKIHNAVRYVDLSRYQLM